MGDTVMQQRAAALAEGEAQRAAALMAAMTDESDEMDWLSLPPMVRAGGRALQGARVKVACGDGCMWAATVGAYSSRRGHCVRCDHVQGEDELVMYVELEWSGYGTEWVLLGNGV